MSRGFLPRYAAVLQAAWVCCLLLSCGAGSACAQQADLNFSGRWDSTYGLLVLEQSGDKVTGTYSSGSFGGSLEGTASKGTLTFAYIETDGTTGTGTFTLIEGGTAFEGTWSAKGITSTQPWNGTRRRTPPPVSSDLTTFDGLFDSTYGRMRLRQDGNSVEGTYLSTSSSGSLTGQVEKGRLTFTYKEPTASGEGWFELSSDGLSFSGQWKPKGGKDFKPWTGARLFAEPNVRWLIILETHWERTLAEQEYSFGEMLRSYFERMPNARVRQRRIADKEDFLRAGAEIAYFAEPVILLISGHGSAAGLALAGETLTEKELLQILGPAAQNVVLLHFSSCDILAGDIPKLIHKGLPKDSRLVISGYAEPVDWSASAVFEMLYLDLVVGRQMDPKTAADIVVSEMNFADDSPTKGSPFGVLRFRIVEP